MAILGIMKTQDNVSDFYKEVLSLLNKSKMPYLVGGGFAINQYTGIQRETKDLDIFCKAKDSVTIMNVFREADFKIENTDIRWLAKIMKGDHFVDIIFDTVNNICTVDESWFTNATKGILFDQEILYVGPEELIWCKIYVQNRERYDGADLNHMFLRYGAKLNWKLLMERLDQHWQLFLQQLINFQFVYPCDRDIIPRWLFDDLIHRAKTQMEIPLPVVKVCRGPLIDQTQYKLDITEWDYKVVTIKTI